MILMKRWYAVGPDLRLTDRLHCSYYDNSLFLFGISQSVQLIQEFISQYEKHVDFRAIEFYANVNKYGNVELDDMVDILNAFNIPHHELIHRYYMHDSSSIELLRVNTDTIHPRHITFTMLQMDRFIQENSESMYLFMLICNLGKKLASLLVVSEYIKDNTDIRQQLTMLMTRYLVIHSIISNFTINNCGNEIIQLSNIIGYDNLATTVCHYISNEYMLQNFIRRLALFDDGMTV